LFTISNASANITLGNNITVQGRTAATGGAGHIINLTLGTFNMAAGSSITEHTVNAATSAAVYVNGAAAIFNMNGGTITDNLRGGATPTTPADVYISHTTAANATNNAPTLNGNAQIGTLTLNATNATINTRINIGSAFNGNVQRLDLRGNNAAVATVIDWWNGRTVLEGNVAQRSRFTLGEFISSNNAVQTTAPRVINASGVLE